MDMLRWQMHTLDEALAVLGEAVSLFLHFWLITTPSVPDSGKAIARAKGTERYNGFMQNPRQALFLIWDVERQICKLSCPESLLQLLWNDETVTPIRRIPFSVGNCAASNS